MSDFVLAIVLGILLTLIIEVTVVVWLFYQRKKDPVKAGRRKASYSPPRSTKVNGVLYLHVCIIPNVRLFHNGQYSHYFSSCFLTPRDHLSVCSSLPCLSILFPYTCTCARTYTSLRAPVNFALCWSRQVFLGLLLMGSQVWMKHPPPSPVSTCTLPVREGYLKVLGLKSHWCVGASDSCGNLCLWKIQCIVIPEMFVLLVSHIYFRYSYLRFERAVKFRCCKSFLQ